MTRESWLTLWGTVLICAPIIAFCYFAFPPNTFSLFCTYTNQYEITGVLETAGGERIRSSAATQRSVSRKWVSVINSGGCKQTKGTVLAFKSSDDRVWLVDTRLCPIAEEVLRDAAAVNLLKICKGKREAYAIDGAATPTTWRRTTLVGDVKLVSLDAVSTNKWPSDNIKQVAPSILEAAFYNVAGEWWDGPAQLLPRPRKVIFKVAEIVGNAADGTLRGAVR